MKKTPPGIYPRNKFTKFQHNPTIFESSRLPRSFRSILGPILSYWAQKTKFSKNEKNTPRYLPKEQVYQISANSDNLWAFYAAPKFLGTHRHTDRHCQILAQLKLRTFTFFEACKNLKKSFVLFFLWNVTIINLLNFESSLSGHRTSNGRVLSFFYQNVKIWSAKY